MTMKGRVKVMYRSQMIWKLSIVLLACATVQCLGRQMGSGNYQRTRGNTAYNRNYNIKRIDPNSNCFYEPYKRSFTCSCPESGMISSVDFKLGQFVSQSRNDIREVYFQNCHELDVIIDLRDIDATLVPIHFRKINRVDIKNISFEPRYSDRQELELDFYNVDQLIFNELTVQDTLKIRATNVKEAKITNSRFAHIPVRGFIISRAKRVEIRDSYFSRISRKSIVVDDTKEVLIYNNQMTVNTFQVVYAKDGSLLSLSCNRLLNQVPTPECTRTTTTTTTTTPKPTTTTQRWIPQQEVTGRSKSESAPEESSKGYLYEIIGGVVGGLLIIVIILLVFVLLRKRSNDKNPVQENLVENSTLNGVQFGSKEGEETKPSENKETDSLILGNEDIRAEEEDEEEKPKFASPIWLEEIQRNKIFNRQKSLLSEDRLADLASAIPDEEEAASSGAENDPLNTSQSPLPEQRSPIQMDDIPEQNEEVLGLDRIITPPPPLDDTAYEQLQNDMRVVDNEPVSTYIVDSNILYNQPRNESTV